MQFSPSKAWSDTVAMLSANREVVLIVAGMFFFVPAFLASFAFGADAQDFTKIFDPAAQEEMAAVYMEYWWVSLVSIIGQLVGSFSLLALLRNADKPTVGEAIKGSFRCILSAFLIYCILVLIGSLAIVALILIGTVTNSVGLATILGAAAFVALLYFGTRLSLVAPVLAIERLFNPIAVLKRSFALTKGHTLRLLGFYVLLTVAYFIILIPFILITAGLGWLLGESASLIVIGLTSALLGAAAAAVFIAIQAAVHDQLAGKPPVSNAGFRFD